MYLSTIITTLICFFNFSVTSQTAIIKNINAQEMVFISDTQQPMTIEKLVLKPTQNSKATAMLFSEIIKFKPKSVFMLGDIVSLGYKHHRWKKVDLFLDSLRAKDVAVYGLLGNHDVMGRTNKGEKNFKIRFKENERTGYLTITDSIAVILLNSNFGKLNIIEKEKQLRWYQTTLKSLDDNADILAIIVCCHHAPYTNSIIVKSSKMVQEYFVTAYLQTKKTKLFITGHAHAFEHFKKMGKDFLVIGGGGGLHQPLKSSGKYIPDLAIDYKPLFHYLSVFREKSQLNIISHFIKKDFSAFDNGYKISISY